MIDLNTILTVLLAAGLLGLLAVGGGLVLGWANRAFHVEEDPKVVATREALPQANCGGCGYVGCADYASAVVSGEAEPNLCGPGGADCARRIASILGIEAGETWPIRAIVHCSATADQRLGRTPYTGEKTCASANLVSDIQGCIYGCLGYGDCEAACPYDAIHVIDGLARVDYEKCTGCRQCVLTCPRNIITVAPFKQNRILAVGCSNREQGPAVKEVCSVGCIGCKACVRPSGGLISMKDGLPVIDYEAYSPETEVEASLEKCRMESLIFVGTPPSEDSPADLEEVERVEADFHTTVADTEWRG